MTYLFWSCLALLLWSYAGYPLLLRLLMACGVSRRSDWRPIEPSVSIIIAAYNEQQVIEQKIRNCLAFDYPTAKMQIIIVSDGSTDRTLEIARSYGGERLLVLDLERGGKAKALNHAVPQATGDVLVFTDANAMLDKGALRQLAGYFADPTIGCVSGIKKMNPAAGAVAEGEGAYWKFERAVKFWEGLVGSCAGADGCFYGIRKELYHQSFESRNIADDLAISINVWQTGHRIVHDRSIVAEEETTGSIQMEFRRKVRIAEGSYRAIATNQWVIKFWRNHYWWQFLSHKLLRWAGPLWITGTLISATVLHGQPLYLVVLALQLILFTVAAIGSRWPGFIPLAGSISHFMVANAAQAWALYQYIFSPRPAFWQTRTG